MTAPDTNMKKQTKRHKGPLVGMAVAVGIALILLLWLLFRTAADTPETQDAPPPAVEETIGVPAEGTVSGPTDTGAPQVDDSPPEPVE